MVSLLPVPRDLYKVRVASRFDLKPGLVGIDGSLYPRSRPLFRKAESIWEIQVRGESDMGMTAITARLGRTRLLLLILGVLGSALIPHFPDG